MTKKGFPYIILFFLLIVSHTSFSQECQIPDPPVLTSVSVQSESGRIDFRWNPSPSPGIAAYILYAYNNGDGLPVDTIWDPAATSYTLNDYALITKVNKYMSQSFVLAAHKLPVIPGQQGCTSKFSNVISTIFCNPAFNKCENSIRLQWNRYTDIPFRVTEYRILISENGGSLNERYTIQASNNEFVIPDFLADRNYCFVVRAILENGTFVNSNKNCISTETQKAPGWINADYATVDENENISLSFTIDPLSELDRFVLERKTGVSGTFDSIARPTPSAGIVTFTDLNADISKINFYRLSAYAASNCKTPVTISNISSGIVLSLETSSDQLNLSWNAYREWAGTVSSYELLMDGGEGYTVKESGLSDTTLTMLLKDIMYDISSGEACFKIRAYEASNPHGLNGQSTSSSACMKPGESVRVPNTFTPNNDQLNDHFRPVLSFTPESYHLIVSNRMGRTLFETHDHLDEWDGSDNGDPLPQGVYLWFLELRTPSGKSISKTGTITIYKGR